MLDGDKFLKQLEEAVRVRDNLEVLLYGVTYDRSETSWLGYFYINRN